MRKIVIIGFLTISSSLLARESIVVSCNTGEVNMAVKNIEAKLIVPSLSANSPKPFVEVKVNSEYYLSEEAGKYSIYKEATAAIRDGIARDLVGQNSATVLGFSKSEVHSYSNVYVSIYGSKVEFLALHDKDNQTLATLWKYDNYELTPCAY